MYGTILNYREGRTTSLQRVYQTWNSRNAAREKKNRKRFPPLERMSVRAVMIADQIKWWDIRSTFTRNDGVYYNCVFAMAYMTYLMYKSGEQLLVLHDWMYTWWNRCTRYVTAYNNYESLSVQTNKRPVNNAWSDT